MENIKSANVQNVTTRDVIIYLDSCGFKHSQKGFDYIISATQRGIKNKALITSGIIKNIYVPIAEEFNSSASKVERAMRHSIESCSDETVQQLTISEFLAQTVDYFIYMK